MIVVEKNISVIKKKVKKVRKIDFKAIEQQRLSTMNNIVNSLNDDVCNISSCKLRMLIFDEVYG